VLTLGALLEVEDLNAFYGKFQALFDVSLNVEKGTVVGIAGPNGAGKSTLLKAIMNLTSYTGNVKFENAFVDHLKPYERVKCGFFYIPEGGGIFPDLTVLENFKLVGSLVKTNLKKELDYIYNLFPCLQKKSYLKARCLSGGEQRILAISQAIICKSKLIMIDELSLGLAPVISQNLLQILKKFREEGLTIILVDQYISNVRSVCDKVYFLLSGKIILREDAKKLTNGIIHKAYFGE
jgi:branched-chain amino acid transport system ATP-binding protein